MINVFFYIISMVGRIENIFVKILVLYDTNCNIFFFFKELIFGLFLKNEFFSFLNLIEGLGYKKN